MTNRSLAALLLLTAWTLPGCAPTDEAPQTPPARTLPDPAAPVVLGADSSEALEAAPDFRLPRLNGETLRLSDYRGQVVLLNFWATWCPPCRAEVPDLIELQRELGPDGLEVIGVSLDEEGFEAVRPFAEQHGITYPLVVDDGSVAAEYGSLYALPTTLVIDKQGRIARRVIGLFPTEEMRPVLEELLAEAVP